VLFSVLVLVVVGVVAYRASFAGVFLLDDGPAIVHNPNIRALWPLTRAMAAPTEVTVAGRPTVSLSLAANYALAQPDVRDVFEPAVPGDPPDHTSKLLANLWGYHAVNLAIHIGAALALFGIARRSLSSTAAPLAIALVWVTHPLTTGSVTYIVQRAESLMGLCFLLTMYFAIRARESHGRLWWSLAAVAACAAGMGSKQVMVAAPLVVAAWDWLIGGPIDDARGRRDRWLLFAGLAATWILLAYLLVTQPRVNSVGFDFPGWPWWRYLVTQAGVIAHYLRLAIVPAPLVFDYGWPAARTISDVAPALALIAGLLALTIWLAMRKRPVAFLGVWFFAILAPTSSIVPIVTEVAAEQRMYLPLAAMVAAGVLGVRWLLSKSTLDARARTWAGAAACAALVTTFSVMTDARNHDYHSDEQIWLDTLQKRPDNPRAHNNYAVDLLMRGETGLAEIHFRAATTLDPEFAEAHANLGAALCRLQRCDEGIVELERALAIRADAKQAHRNLGEAYAARGEFPRALDHFLLALDAEPDDPVLLNRAGWILATSPDASLRNGARALTLAEHAVAVTHRTDPISLDTLGAAYAELGRFPDAITATNAARDLARDRGDAQFVSELDTRISVYNSRRAFRQ
jgi:Flp pilus assembly protein TadD